MSYAGFDRDRVGIARHLGACDPYRNRGYREDCEIDPQRITLEVKKIHMISRGGRSEEASSFQAFNVGRYRPQFFA